MSYRTRTASSPAYANGRFYKSAEHLEAARLSRADWQTAGAAAHIDMREIRKLQRAMMEWGISQRRATSLQVMALNRAGDRVRTQLKRSLQKWTGIRRQKSLFDRTHKAFHPIIATSANMRAGVTVGGRHLRITKADFGASWQRSWPGGRHKAWNRSQTAKGTFMAFAGRGSSYGGGLLFHRTSSKRFPIKPLWGPHPAREMIRHKDEVRRIVQVEAKWFMGESMRLVAVEGQRVKAKYGL